MDSDDTITVASSSQVPLHFALVRVQCTLGVTLKFLYHLNQVVAAMKRFDRLILFFRLALATGAHTEKQ